MCTYCDNQAIDNLANIYNNPCNIYEQIEALDTIERLCINMKEIYDDDGDACESIYLMATGYYYHYNYTDDVVIPRNKNSLISYCPVCGRKL